MRLNAILAFFIVLIFILFFVIWFFAALLGLMTSPGEALKFIIPGALFFGFWFLIAYRLFTCPN